MKEKIVATDKNLMMQAYQLVTTKRHRDAIDHVYHNGTQYEYKRDRGHKFEYKGVTYKNMRALCEDLGLNYNSINMMMTRDGFSKTQAVDEAIRRMIQG